LNIYREKLHGVKRIPDLVYNMFKKNFEEPDAEKEGFSSVTKIDWFPDFETDQQKLLFLERTS
jgi:hypothetical protein